MILACMPSKEGGGRRPQKKRMEKKETRTRESKKEEEDEQKLKTCRSTAKTKLWHLTFLQLSACSWQNTTQITAVMNTGRPPSHPKWKGKKKINTCQSLCNETLSLKHRHCLALGGGPSPVGSTEFSCPITVLFPAKGSFTFRVLMGSDVSTSVEPQNISESGSLPRLKALIVLWPSNSKTRNQTTSTVKMETNSNQVAFQEQWLKSCYKPRSKVESRALHSVMTPSCWECLITLPTTSSTMRG